MPPRIVIARKPRRTREPSQPRPLACGPVVRVVRGKRVAEPIDPEADERARVALQRMLEDARRPK